jgi:hypothetical protein
LVVVVVALLLQHTLETMDRIALLAQLHLLAAVVVVVRILALGLMAALAGEVAAATALMLMAVLEIHLLQVRPKETMAETAKCGAVETDMREEAVALLLLAGLLLERQAAMAVMERLHPFLVHQ